MAWTVKTIHRNDLANPVADSNAISYTFRKVMNNCSEAVVTFNDSASASTQKYNDLAAAATYLGGRLQIEDPTNTKIFDGCIVRIQSNPEDGTLDLFCRDWLQQLDREHITYDTREDLDGAGLRESQAKGDVDVTEGDPGVNIQKNMCTHTLDYGDGQKHWFIDDDMAWNNDDWNGKYLLIPAKSGGSQTVSCGPYSEVVTPDDAAMTTDTPLKGQSVLWVNDDNDHEMKNDDGWNVVYYFYLGGDDSALVDDVEEVRLQWTWEVLEQNAGGFTGCTAYYYDWLTTTWLPCWGTGYNNVTEGRETETMILEEYYGTRMFDNGRAKIKFDFNYDAGVGGWIACEMYSIRMFADIVGVVDSSSYLINDTITTNRLEMDADVDMGGAGIYEGVAYAIAGVITSHLSSLVGDYDTDVTLDFATDVTASTDIVGRNFYMMTPLEILRELAEADGTVFWLDDDLDLHWNDTFALNGEDTWTDSDVLQWRQPRITVKDLYNKIIVKGMAHEEEQVSDTDSDAASEGFYGTYTYVVENPAIYTDKEASDLAAALESKYSTARYRVDAEVNDLSTKVIGEVININSSTLQITNQKYVITEIQYDSQRGSTYISMAPRATALNVELVFQDTLHHIKREIDHVKRHVDFGPSHTETWS